MSKEFIEGLLAVNCAYNFNPEVKNPTTTEIKCYSTSCMLNTDKEIAEDIQRRGCVIYTKQFVQDVINKKQNNL